MATSDEAVYRAGFSSQHTVHRVYLDGEEEDGWVASFRYAKKAKEWVEYWGVQDFHIEKELKVDSLHLALYNTRAYVDKILRNTKSDEYIIFFTGPDNFRDKVATTLPYKGNRDPSHKPVYYKEIKAFLLKNYSCKIMNGLEADDGLSIEGWDAYYNYQLIEGLPRSEVKGAVICTQDKDLNMVPGWRYNPVRDEMWWNEPLEACRSFYKQLVTGDSTDNIPSVKHFTDLKRFNHKKHTLPIDELDSEEDMYNFVMDLYEGNIEAVREVGQLLWMKRSPDEDWEPGEFYYDL